jgi:hypothetical protein
LLHRSQVGFFLSHLAVARIHEPQLVLVKLLR